MVVARLVVLLAAVAAMLALDVGGWRDRLVGSGMPFTNLSGDEQDAYFSDGIAEEIVGHLSRIQDLKEELAIEQLESLLSIPADLAAPGLRLDPAWDTLRDHPRFQRRVR